MKSIGYKAEKDAKTSGLVRMSGDSPHVEGRRLRLLWAVRSELPFPPFLVAEERVYEPHEIRVNPHGAVCVLTAKGWLGIKPDEMEWIGK